MNSRERVESAADAFYGALANDFWEEHGIDRDEAKQGMLAAFKAIGLLNASKVRTIRKAWKRQEDEERAKRNLEREEYLASLTPEQRQRETSFASQMLGISNMMRESVIDNIFKSNSIFNVLKSKS